VTALKSVSAAWAHLLIATACLAYVLIVPWYLQGRTAPYDDAFITLRYAKHFAEGRGFVYNPGETTLGTTSPAYGLLVGVILKAIGSTDAVRVADWLSAVAIAIGAWLAFALVLRDFGPLGGIVTGLSTLVNPMLIATWGGEWLVAIAAIAGGMLALQRQRLVIAALVLTIAVIFRAEAAIGSGIFMVWMIARYRREALRPWGAALGAGVVWVLVLWAVTGHVLPATLAAKLAHGRSGLFGTVLGSAWSVIVAFTGAGLPMIPVALLAWHGALLAALSPGLWQCLLAWVVTHLVFYQALHMPIYHWYLTPLVYAITLMAGIGMEAVARYIRLLSPTVAGRLVATAVVWLLAAGALSAEWRAPYGWLQTRPHSGERFYNEVAQWLADKTPAEASVAYLEIGRIGYYSDRRIIDQMGLVTPEAIPHMPERNFAWVVYRFKPDYYLVHSGFTWAPAPTDEPWFARAYRPAATFRSPYFNNTLTAYQLQDASAIPPTRRVQVPQPNGTDVVGDIVAGMPQAQTFRATEDRLTAVATRLATWARKNQGVVRVRLEQVDPPKLVLASEFDMAEVVDNAWRSFRFSPVADSRDRTYRLTIDAPSASQGNAITLWYDPASTYENGQRFVAGRPAPGDWTLRLTYEDAPDAKHRD